MATHTIATQLLSDPLPDPRSDPLSVPPPNQNENTGAGLQEALTDPDSPAVMPLHRSALERFFDSFFQPANIKWMLIVGASIVLGSSLMLVTKQWSDWQAAMKFLAMLSYTAAIWLFAEFGDRRLGLKVTGNVLRGLSLLLFPILILALSWVGTQASTTGLPSSLEMVVLLIPTTALLYVASSRILHHFLRGHQIPFLVSYMLLAIAGLLPRATEPWLAVLVIAALWTVFTVGVVKVNRHVFWLAEEHRLPRVFGFFPILLLSSQFLVLCVTKALFVAPTHWIGLAIVLLAATILGTTRSIASVFRARTGDLVRPLPWSIALPLFVGVLLIFAGVATSFLGFHFVGPTTYAVVPTALIATFLLFFVAYDSKHWAFTALALVLVTIAYQCTPTLIADWIQMLKAGAASAMNEDKLPIAFYGITYLPLLISLTGIACWLSKRGRQDMSAPMQSYIAFITLLLWCISLLHIKALFIVAAINVVLFIGYAIAFQDRRYITGALLAAVLIGASLFPFANAMFATHFGINSVVLSLIVLAAIFNGTNRIDKAMQRIPLRRSALDLVFLDPNGNPNALAQPLGFAMLAALGYARFIWISWLAVDFSDPSSLAIDILLVACFSWIAFRKLHCIPILVSAVLAITSAVGYANYLGWTFGDIVEQAAILATCASLVGLLMTHWLNSGEKLSSVRKKFGWHWATFQWITPDVETTGRSERWLEWIRCNTVVWTDIATTVAALIGLAVYVPNAVIMNWNWGGDSGPRMAATFLIGWLVACTLVIRSRWAATALAAIAPLYATLALAPLFPSLFADQWPPLVWACVASLFCCLSHFYAKREFALACFVSRIWLCAIALIALIYLSVPIRIAGAIGLGTLLLARGNITLRGERMFVAILCNVHVLLLVANLAGAQGWVFQNYQYPKLLHISAALVAALSVSIAVSDFLLRRISVVGSEWWSANLRILAALFFVIACVGPVATATSQGLVVVGIAVAFLCEWIAATRTNSPVRAWSSIATLCLAGVWGWDQGWIEIGNGWSQLMFVVIAAICLWASNAVRSHARLTCYTGPLLTIGLVLPGVASAVSACLELIPYLQSIGMLGQFSTRDDMSTHPVHFLALTAAAAVYFFYGLESRKKGYVILSAVILNVGLAILWFTNGLSDPQFYCVPIGLSILGIVELLRKELPTASQDPLRYVGALVILVSPVYGICGSGWLHLFSLMVLSVFVILVAIGLRIRVLMYTGTAFLFADIVGILIRSTMDNPILLWVGGVALGGGVIAFAALCENHRENMLAKIRMLTAELATWN